MPRAHPVQVRAGPAPAAPAQHQVRGPRHAAASSSPSTRPTRSSCTRSLRELGELLDGFEGPYILTDLRWRDGPLYVRYGAFARTLRASTSGAAGAGGRGRPRARSCPTGGTPAFQVPEWVTLPAFLRAAPGGAQHHDGRRPAVPHREGAALLQRRRGLRGHRHPGRQQGRPQGGPAARGARRRRRRRRGPAGAREGRPGAGWPGLGVVPEVRDWFTLGDHRFLVMDFLEGRPLNSFFAERHPLLTPDPDPRGRRRVHGVGAADPPGGRGGGRGGARARGRLQRPAHVQHHGRARRGVGVPARLRGGGAGRRRTAGRSSPTPASSPRRTATGIDVDRYALACLRLALFLPITTLFVVDRGKAAHLAEVIAATSSRTCPKEFLDEAVDGDPARPRRRARRSGARRPSAGRGRPLVDPADWPHSRDSMVKAILASATPERDDRLFPGDIAQFADGGGLGLAHGAAGVLLRPGRDRRRAVRGGRALAARRTPHPPPTGTRSGFYDGLAGVAHVLDRLGHRQRALDLVERVLAREVAEPLLRPARRAGRPRPGPRSNWPARTGEAELRGAGRARPPTDPRTTTRASRARTRRGGAGPGCCAARAGPRCFLLRLYERTGDPELLDWRPRRPAPGPGRLRDRTRAAALEVDEGWRTMPYLGDGSVGIGMVLDDYLAHRRRRPGSSSGRGRAS